MKQKKLIVALDVGTTNVRCHVYSEEATVIGSAIERVTGVISGAIDDAGVAGSDVAALGIAVQRNTFLTWSRETGEPYHRFVAWNDARSRDYDAAWNNSWTFALMHLLGRMLYFLTRSPRWLAASIFKLIGAMVTNRLLFTIDQNDRLKEAVERGEAAFGCLETWLLWKLRGEAGQLVTDVGLASATGMFDPYQVAWGRDILRLLSFPMDLLPGVVDSVGDFGFTDIRLFGAMIPIRAVMGDQMAAVFGCGGRQKGDVVLSLGTGTFADVVCAKAHASMAGLIPLIGWRLPGEKPVHLAEGFSHDTASVLNWAQSIGLFDEVEATSDMAKSVPDSGGVYFVPAFYGLQAPVNDDGAAALFIGLKPSTNKGQMVRALLDSIAFRAAQILRQMEKERLSDLSGRRLERIGGEATSSGIARAAAAALELEWPEPEPERVFEPEKENSEKIKAEFEEWERAVQRSLKWY